MTTTKRILLSIMFAVISASIIGIGQNCFSYLTVSIASAEAISLEGFTITMDGRSVDTSDGYGNAQIDLSGISKGRHTIAASKKDERGSFAGGNTINIPCINASAENGLDIFIEVKSVNNRPLPNNPSFQRDQKL
jgi:hypothetical protein